MKYYDIINSMVYDIKYGFVNIVKSDKEFKDKIIAEIKRARCSIVTARMFIGFIEVQLERHENVKMADTMLAATVLIGNQYGLDPTRYTENVTAEDVQDIKMVMSGTDARDA